MTAFFLNFINQRYNPMIYWVNKDCREGTYNHNIFPRLTGKTLDDHWADMMREARIAGQDVTEWVKPFGNDAKCLQVQD